MKILNVKEGYDYFASYYHQQYKHLDSFDWDILKEIIYKEIDKFANFSDKEIFIGDFGCGDGRILTRILKYINEKKYSNIKLYGLDISENMVKIAQKKLNKEVKLIICDIENDNIYLKQNQKFDLIYSIFLLVHIDDIEKFFGNVSESLKSNGIFIFNNIPQKKGFKLPFIKEETYIEFYNHSNSKVESHLPKYFNYFEIHKTDFSTIYKCYK